MTTTVRQQLARLYRARDIVSKSIEVSNELEHFEELNLEGFILGFLELELQLFDPEYFLLKVSKYVDFDSMTKIAVSVSFVQDHSVYDSKLEDKVLETLVSELKSRNLHYIFNDVSVNGKQWRNDGEF